MVEGGESSLLEQTLKSWEHSPGLQMRKSVHVCERGTEGPGINSLEPGSLLEGTDLRSGGWVDVESMDDCINGFIEEWVGVWGETDGQTKCGD